MKIRIEQKELKSLLEKVLPQITKKTKIVALECVLLESKSGVLSASATDLESYLTVTTDKYNNIEDGKLLIHKDDIKLISKLSGELEINTISEHESVIKTDKKSISIRLYDIEGYPIFPQVNSSKSLFTIQENQFTTAINKLIKFVSDNENNKTMQCYNINMQYNRIEALDGFRIGVIDITPEQFEDSKTIMIHSKINNHLKKVLDIKSDEQIIIEMTNPKAPCLIHATGEKYLVLPVNLDREGSTEFEVKEYIKNAA